MPVGAGGASNDVVIAGGGGATRASVSPVGEPGWYTEGGAPSAVVGSSGGAISTLGAAPSSFAERAMRLPATIAIMATMVMNVAAMIDKAALKRGASVDRDVDMDVVEMGTIHGKLTFES